MSVTNLAVEEFEEINETTKEYPSDFEGLTNWRDLGGWTIKSAEGKLFHVRKNYLFRSATPATGTTQDIRLLLEHIGVKTFVDLRAENEYLENEKTCPYRTLCKEEMIKRRPIYGYSFMIKGVLGGCSFNNKVDAFKNILKGDSAKAKRCIISHMNVDGLFGLYVLFLEHCKPQICKALSTFLDPNRYPMHIYCNAGKDRTGLISAFLLISLGVDRESVLDDYARTQQADFSKHKAFESSLVKAGLKAEFMDAPREAMEKTMQYLDRNCGGPISYLDRIGFDFEKRSRLQKIMLVRIKENNSIVWVSPIVRPKDDGIRAPRLIMSPRHH